MSFLYRKFFDIMLCLSMFFIASLNYSTDVQAQPLYFPPITGTTWDTISPTALGWNTEQIDTLYDFLMKTNTKAFIVLKDGRIAIERYFGNFARDSLWYWASAGKSLIAFLIGIAQQEGKLAILKPTKEYLGEGWTSCPPEMESRITIWHQLTMTSGFDDKVSDPYCTLPSCLQCIANPGTRWAYHNAPYTLLHKVLENATGQSVNIYLAQKLRLKTGISGVWLQDGYNQLFVSTARSMARFGLLILNKGVWQNDTIMKDTSYFQQMINSSQTLNPAYGYLWWLNGKESFMLPGMQIVFHGWLAPDAPQDMIAALGKNGQILSIAPSSRLIVVRMGDAPDSSIVEVTTILTNEIWKRLNAIMGTASEVHQSSYSSTSSIELYPNPFTTTTTFRFSLPQLSHVTLKVYDSLGREIATLLDGELNEGEHSVVFDAKNLSTGVYFLCLRAGNILQQKIMMIAK